MSSTKCFTDRLKKPVIITIAAIVMIFCTPAASQSLIGTIAGAGGQTLFLQNGLLFNVEATTNYPSNGYTLINGPYGPSFTYFPNTDTLLSDGAFTTTGCISYYLNTSGSRVVIMSPTIKGVMCYIPPLMYGSNNNNIIAQAQPGGGTCSGDPGSLFPSQGATTQYYICEYQMNLPASPTTMPFTTTSTDPSKRTSMSLIWDGWPQNNAYVNSFSECLFGCPYFPEDGSGDVSPVTSQQEAIVAEFVADGIDLAGTNGGTPYTIIDTGGQTIGQFFSTCQNCPQATYGTIINDGAEAGTIGLVDYAGPGYIQPDYHVYGYGTPLCSTSTTSPSLVTDPLIARAPYLLGAIYCGNLQGASVTTTPTVVEFNLNTTQTQATGGGVLSQSTGTGTSTNAVTDYKTESGAARSNADLTQNNPGY